MFRISKNYTFEAAHHLPLHNGQCRRVHGHSYSVDVVVSGTYLQVDGSSTGMLLDFSDLDICTKRVIDDLDHQDLNEMLGDNTTAEHVAFSLFQSIERGLRNLGLPFPVTLESVRVWETRKCWAEYTKEKPHA